jgi:histidine ammonia-lyase
VVTLASRNDITLEAFERVAWRGEGVAIAPAALERVEAARAAFLRLVSRPDVTVYGVTSGFGDRAGVALDEDDRRRQTSAAAIRAASFGDPLPERVARGIVLARLANLVEGHAAVSGGVTEAVAGLLDGRPLPPVPVQGNGGSGEILALAHLLGPLMDSIELGDKEGLALINGSPCAAALIADAALAAGRRLELAYDVFAMSIEAFRSPLDAYDEALEELWDDSFETEALRQLRRRLDASGERRPHQGPVAFRIVPRLLGQLERAVSTAAEVAAVSLRSVTDNPVYVPPSAEHEDGRVLSTGGYHNAAGPAALHQLAVCWADLCQLAERHVERFVYAQAPLADGEELSRLLMMVAVGYAEEARAAAQPVVVPRGGPGQNDVTSPAFLAWARERDAADGFVAVLAVLAAAACLELGSRSLSHGLERVQGESRPAAAAVAAGRAAGTSLGALAESFRERVLMA